MDVKIKIGSALSPQEKTVSNDDVVREIFTANNIAFRDGDVTLNGRVLGTAELNMTVGELGLQDGDFLLVNTKQNSGQLSPIN